MEKNSKNNREKSPLIVLDKTEVVYLGINQYRLKKKPCKDSLKSTLLKGSTLRNIPVKFHKIN